MVETLYKGEYTANGLRPFSPLLIGAMVETEILKDGDLSLEVFQSPFNRGNG